MKSVVWGIAAEIDRAALKVVSGRDLDVCGRGFDRWIVVGSGESAKRQLHQRAMKRRVARGPRSEAGREQLFVLAASIYVIWIRAQSRSNQLGTGEEIHLGKLRNLRNDGRPKLFEELRPTRIPDWDAAAGTD